MSALNLQAGACRTMGSMIYGDLFEGLAADFAAGGLTYDLLAERHNLWADAIQLRLVGATHRLALSGQAPALAAHYPSCGGTPGPTLVADHQAVLEEHRDYVVEQLDQQVQTNEVARTALLAVGFSELARRYKVPLRTREVGASAGLISRWSRYWFDCFGSACGDPDSPVRFTDNWSAPFDLGGDPTVVDRAACDIAPLDPSDDEARTRLVSFVWPDQALRLERLRAALDIAAGDPLPIAKSPAASWVAENVDVCDGTTTVLFHSIVWQYLTRHDKDGLRAHLAEMGERATADAPLAWLRMEPAGGVADLRLTTWPGGIEESLATSGFHGADITPCRT